MKAATIQDALMGEKKVRLFVLKKKKGCVERDGASL